MLEVQLAMAGDIIRRGGVVAYPTEGVWGLGCDPLQRQTVERIIKMKQRKSNKGLIIITTPLLIDQLPLSDVDKQIICNNPGITWVTHNISMPAWIRGDHSGIAVRITTHHIAHKLCTAADTSIVSTSANISHKQAPKNSILVRKNFGKKVDYFLQAPLGNNQNSTPICDINSWQWIRK